MFVGVIFSVCGVIFSVRVEVSCLVSCRCLWSDLQCLRSDLQCSCRGIMSRLM